MRKATSKIGVLKITSSPDKKGKDQELQINKSKKRINATLQVFYIQDGAFKVAFIPALNLSGYGKSHKKACEMLEEVMSDYFHSLIVLKKDQLLSELSKYGWTTKLFRKQFINNTFVDKYGVLKNFKLPKNTPIKESMVEVA